MTSTEGGSVGVQQTCMGVSPEGPVCEVSKAWFSMESLLPRSLTFLFPSRSCRHLCSGSGHSPSSTIWAFLKSKYFLAVQSKCRYLTFSLPYTLPEGDDISPAGAGKCLLDFHSWGFVLMHRSSHFPAQTCRWKPSSASSTVVSRP